MKAVLLPCSLCSAPGVRNYGDTGWCVACLTRIDSYLFAGGDDRPCHGWQNGPLRPDWGPGFADLRCSCSATWVGPIGEACTVCDAVKERHRQQLFAGPCDGEDADGWARRLGHNVIAGVMTEHEALKAIHQYMRGRRTDAE